MEQVKVVSEATKEELEAALATLDDLYKPFKDALKAGKRVRCYGGPWYAVTDKNFIGFSWTLPPEEYEIEPEPILYCGHTKEEWQFVIDGGFDVKVSDESVDHAEKAIYTRALNRLYEGFEFPFEVTTNYWKYCHIVRRKNHPQPAFGRSVEDNDEVLCHYETGEYFYLTAGTISWDGIDWYINLSRDG